MSVNHFYGLCCKYHGRTVRIMDRGGKVHNGRITKVTRSHVYIQPVRPRIGGYGYGYWGPGWGYGGYGYAIPLAFITGLALGGLFWW